MRFMLALVLVAATACGNVALEPLPLDLALDATPSTLAVGDTATIVATGQGGTLLGLVTDYGDGVVESYATSGARTARVSFRHAYKSKGTFSVHVTLTDGVAGQKDATIQIHVT